MSGLSFPVLEPEKREEYVTRVKDLPLTQTATIVTMTTINKVIARKGSWMRGILAAWLCERVSVVSLHCVDISFVLYLSLFCFLVFLCGRGEGESCC